MHIDQSYSGAELIVHMHFPFLAPTLFVPNGPRWCIINLWRPVSTIYKDPLAIASASSVPDSDLVEGMVMYTKQTPPVNGNRTWTILPGEGHRWYYKNEQRPDEVWLVKCFDSKDTPGLARRTPHCAFTDPEREGDGFADRESVEVRAVLVFDR